VTVPDVVGQLQTAAQSAIVAANLVVGSMTTQWSYTVPANVVISQSPAPGIQVSPGTTIGLVVSIGPPPALSVDASTFSDGLGAQTTAPFSTSVPYDLLLAFASSDGPSTGAQTLGVSGAGLTWTLVQRANTQTGTAEIWKATATGLLTNVTVTATSSNGGYRQSLAVVAFKGASGTGASATANGATGAPSVTLVTIADGSLVYGVGIDSDRGFGRTLGPGQTMVHQLVDSNPGDTLWVQAWADTVTAAGTSIQLNDTKPTNDRWNFASVEIRKWVDPATAP
jgi:hypothetical protein